MEKCLNEIQSSLDQSKDGVLSLAALTKEIEVPLTIKHSLRVLIRQYPDRFFLVVNVSHPSDQEHALVSRVLPQQKYRPVQWSKNPLERALI